MTKDQDKGGDTGSTKDTRVEIGKQEWTDRSSGGGKVIIINQTVDEVPPPPPQKPQNE